MQYRVKRISPHSAGKVAGVVWGCFSLLFWPFVLLAQFASKASGQTAIPPYVNLIFLILPLFYAVFGYLSTALMCAVYNFASRYTGPLVLEMDADAGDAPARA